MGVSTNAGLTKSRDPQKPAPGQEQDLADLSQESLSSAAIDKAANPVLNAQGRPGWIANAVASAPPTETKVDMQVNGGRESATTRSDFRSIAQNAVSEGLRAQQYALEQGATLEEAAAAKSHAETYVTASGGEETQLQREREQAQTDLQAQPLAEEDLLSEKNGENSPLSNAEPLGVESDEKIDRAGSLEESIASGLSDPYADLEALSIDESLGEQLGKGLEAEREARLIDPAVDAAIDELFSVGDAGINQGSVRSLEESLESVRSGRAQFVRAAQFEASLSPVDLLRREFGQQASEVSDLLDTKR